MTGSFRLAALTILLAAGAAQAQGVKFEFKADKVTIGKDGVKVEGGKSKITPIVSPIVRIKRGLIALKLWQGKVDDKVDDKLKAAAKKYRESVGFHPSLPAIQFTNDEGLAADLAAEQNIRAKKWGLLDRRVFDPDALKTSNVKMIVLLYGPVGAMLEPDGAVWNKGKDTGAAHPRFALLIGDTPVRFDPGAAKLADCCGVVASDHDGLKRIVFETPIDDETCGIRRDVFSLRGDDLAYRRRNAFCGVKITSGKADATKLEFGQPTYLVPNFAGAYPARFAFDGDDFILRRIEHDAPLASYTAFAGKPPGKPADGAGKTIFDEKLVALVKGVSPRAGNIFDQLDYGAVTSENGALVVRGKRGLFDRLALVMEPASGRVIVCLSDFDGNEIAATDVQPPRKIAGERDAACPAETAALKALADKPPAAE